MPSTASAALGDVGRRSWVRPPTPGLWSTVLRISNSRAAVFHGPEVAPSIGHFGQPHLLVLFLSNRHLSATTKSLKEAEKKHVPF